MDMVKSYRQNIIDIISIAGNEMLKGLRITLCVLRSAVYIVC